MIRKSDTESAMMAIVFEQRKSSQADEAQMTYVSVGVHLTSTPALKKWVIMDLQRWHMMHDEPRTGVGKCSIRR